VGLSDPALEASGLVGAALDEQGFAGVLERAGVGGDQQAPRRSTGFMMKS